jgi:hypothetical protein
MNNLTAIVGKKWEVAHEIPRRGRLVSGLDASWNMKVISRVENYCESNDFNPLTYQHTYMDDWETQSFHQDNVCP